ncbi:YadA-like family protein [Methylobacterium pseudosasicola]|nr:YadA-like family protein [Methylobacterium pseudosasicola]
MNTTDPRFSRCIRRDLLTTTAVAIGLGLMLTGSARAQSSYAAGGGSTPNANNNATAIGPGATASGDRSFAGGYNATSSGADSTAIGSGASGTGAGAVAIGSGAKAQSATKAQGIINYRDRSGAGISGAAAGGDLSSGSNGSTAPPNETSDAGSIPSGTAIGLRSTVGAAGGVAVGYNNSAGNPDYNSTAIGTSNSANGAYGVAIGYGNTADGRSTLSLGTGNQASGDIAIALGRQSYAVGDFSFAQGFIASAYGQDALAIGRLSVAGEKGANSTVSNIAIGDNTSAQGGSALAIGSGAKASSKQAVAIGSNTMALRGTISGTEAYSGTALSSANTEFSVGDSGTERLITNVAGGQKDTDAVNVRQLRGLGNTLGTTLGSSFDQATNTYTPPKYSYAKRNYSTIPDLVGSIDSLALRYDTDGGGKRLASIDLTRGGDLGSAVSITGLAPATTDSGAVALSQMPLRYSTASSPTVANPAVPSNDVTLVGSNARQTVLLHNVGPGDITTSASTDAVNGSQLYTTNQKVAALQNGSLGLVQQDQTTRTISVGKGTDGNAVDFTGTDGARRLTGVAVGTSDSDAATLGQLRATSDALGGGAGYDATGVLTKPSYSVGGQIYRDVGSALAASNNLAVQYVPDRNGNSTNVVDLAKGGTTAVSLRGVASGLVAVGSTEAVNGGQLYAVSNSVTDLQNGTSGLVRQDPTSRAISIGGATDGTVVSIADQNGTARTLTGVGTGQIAAGSTQAINGGQIYAVGASVASALGGGAGIAGDGTLRAPSYAIQGATYNTVGGALGGLNAAVTTLSTNGSRYVAVRSTGAAAQALGADSVAIGPAASANADRGVALGAGSVASRAGMAGAAEAFSGAAVNSTQGAISVGFEGGERQITNVAGGTQDTDAVNLRQVRALGGNLAGALGGGARFTADGGFTAPSYTIGGQTYASVGAALGAVDTFGVRYDVDPSTGGRGQSMTLAGGDPNQPVMIRNVAAGVLATDVANTGQVAQAKADANAYTDRSVAVASAASAAYTDAAVAPLQKQMSSFGSQLLDLNRQVGEVRADARRGAAIGLAAAALRFDDRPGKLSVAAGGGAWRGEAAASFGVGYTLPDGTARVNATGVAAGRDFGIGAGASFTLN